MDNMDNTVDSDELTYNDILGVESLGLILEYISDLIVRATNGILDANHIKNSERKTMDKAGIKTKQLEVAVIRLYAITLSRLHIYTASSSSWQLDIRNVIDDLMSTKLSAMSYDVYYKSKLFSSDILFIVSAMMNMGLISFRSTPVTGKLGWFPDIDTNRAKKLVSEDQQGLLTSLLACYGNSRALVYKRYTVRRRVTVRGSDGRALQTEGVQEDMIFDCPPCGKINVITTDGYMIISSKWAKVVPDKKKKAIYNWKDGVVCY